MQPGGRDKAVTLNQPVLLYSYSDRDRPGSSCITGTGSPYSYNVFSTNLLNAYFHAKSDCFQKCIYHQVTCVVIPSISHLN